MSTPLSLARIGDLLRDELAMHKNSLPREREALRDHVNDRALRIADRVGYTGSEKKLLASVEIWIRFFHAELTLPNGGVYPYRHIGM